MKHAYIVPFSVNAGTKDNPKWEQRASLMIDGRGELLIRVRQGQIKYADNPVLVYEGDEFMHGTTKGSVFLEHKAVFPRKSDNIIACYLRIERPDGSVDYKVMGIDEVLKLKEFGKNGNSLAWTKGLPGMVQTKCIKHAFRSYPKVKLGNFTKLQTESIEPTPEVTIDYGLNDAAEELPQATGTFTPVMIVEPVKQPVQDDEFVSKAQPSGSKSFDDDDF
jgi:recombinational DNA repair protein RecT